MEIPLRRTHASLIPLAAGCPSARGERRFTGKGLASLLIPLALLAAGCSAPRVPPTAGGPAAGTGTAALPAPLTVAATVEVADPTPLYPAVAGRVAEITVAAGDTVVAGQIVATLARPEVAAEHAAAARELGEAHAALIAANAEATVQRNRMRQAGGICAQQAVSDPELAKARAPLDRALANLQVARARVRGAQARVTALEADLEHGRVRAPFAGLVAARLADPGTRVRPRAPGSRGRPLLVVGRLDPVVAAAEAPARESARVARGSRATFAPAASPEYPVTGTVTRVGAPGAGRRRMRLEVALPNPDGALRPGMDGTLTIDVPG